MEASPPDPSDLPLTDEFRRPTREERRRELERLLAAADGADELARLHSVYFGCAPPDHFTSRALVSRILSAEYRDGDGS